MSFAIPDPGGLLHKVLGVPSGQPLLYNPEGALPLGTLNQFDPNQVQREMLGGFLNPVARAAVEFPTGYRLRFASNAAPVAKAPGFIAALHNLGVPIPGYTDQKKDYATGNLVPGYSAKMELLGGLLPAYSQGGRLTSLDPTRQAQAALSILGGLSLTPYDRAQLLANIQKFANR
jgi:hypothetical protein